MKIIKSKNKCPHIVWDAGVHLLASMSNYGSTYTKHPEEDFILEFTLSTKVVNRYFNAYDII